MTLSTSPSNTGFAGITEPFHLVGQILNDKVTGFDSADVTAAFRRSTKGCAGQT